MAQARVARPDLLPPEAAAPATPAVAVDVLAGRSPATWPRLDVIREP